MLRPGFRLTPVVALMNWLDFRGVLKTRGHYGRAQFLFWLVFPITCIILISSNTWGLEQLLIRLSFLVGLPALNARLATQVIAVLVVLFLTYVLIVAMVKRSRAIGSSGFLVMLLPVPLIGMLFLAFLVVWPGRVPHPETKKKDWVGIVALSVATTVIFLVLTILSLLFVTTGLLETLAWLRWERETIPLRVWNQTHEVLGVELIVTEGVLHQGFPIGEVEPNEIIKRDETFLYHGRYIFTAKDNLGETVYSKNIRYEDLGKGNGLIVISGP